MLKQISLLVLLGMSASAMAGNFQLKVGASALTPTGDTKTALGVVEADHEFQFTPSVEYFFNDYISTELLLATPFNHDVLLDGNKVAKVKHLPPTLTVKYNLANKTRFTPYAGVGATVFIPWDEEGVAKDVKADVGIAGQLGVNFDPTGTGKFGVYLDVRYADLSPEVKLKESVGGAKFDLNIDPVVYTIGYSYKF